MSLIGGIDSQLNGIARGITSPFSVGTKPALRRDDYPEGFFIEQVAGAKRKLQLNGTNMPHQPFEYGGGSKLTKQWYPGNSEPTIQVLGSEEKNVTIRGRFYSKKYRDQTLYAAPKAIVDRIETIRREGEIVKISLGGWQRYCLLNDCVFKEKNQADIEYEITFEIISEKTPTQCYQLTNRKDETFQDSTNLADQASEFQSTYGNNSEIEQSFSDVLNGYIDDVASAIAAVNDFVNILLTQAESIEAGVTRALGLIKVARNNVSRMIRRVGALSYAISGDDVTKQYNTISHTARTISTGCDLMALLAKLQSQFEAIRKTLPKARYRVQEGDSLQKISVKFYGNADTWSKIYDHNKLTTTALTRGTVLEIPNI